MRKPSYLGSKNSILDAYLYAKNTRYSWGFIESVDIDKGQMNVRLSSTKLLKNIIINQGACGPYHGMRTMPRKSNLVLLAYEYDNNIYHIATIPFKYFQWHERTMESSTTQTNTTGTLLSRKLKEGETEISACDENGMLACSITLLQDGTIEENSKGDIKRFKAGHSAEEEVCHSTIKADRCRRVIGEVKRKNPATGEDETKAYGGIPYTGTGNCLDEYIIKVGQEVNPATGEDIGTPIAAVKLSDQLLDDLGIPIIDLEGKSIVCDIQMKSGAHITINESGKINVNEANPLTMPIKKVARNGDCCEQAI